MAIPPQRCLRWGRPSVDLHPMKTLVTGGAGFVGSHLVDALLERGDDVFVLDDLSTGRGSNLFDAVAAGAIAIPADVTDPGAVSRVLAADPPRVVFHLAGQTDREIARSDPGLGARIDVEGTVNLLEAARRAGVRRLVLASSFEVYGDRVPAREDDEACPRCPAGLAKLAAERYAGLYAERYGLATVSVRLASVYGPRQVPLGGGGVVAAFALALTRGGSPVLFGDGLQTRDFLYVDDAVGLLLAAADSDLAGVVNAGTGRGTSIGDLLHQMAKIAGDGDLDPVPEPEREGEARQCRPQLPARRRGARLGAQHRPRLRPRADPFGAGRRTTRGAPRPRRRARHGPPARAGRGAGRGGALARGRAVARRPSRGPRPRPTPRSPSRTRCRSRSSSLRVSPSGHPHASEIWAISELVRPPECRAATAGRSDRTPRGASTSRYLRLPLCNARPGLRRQGVRVPVTQGDLRSVAASRGSSRPLCTSPACACPAAVPGGRRRRRRPREGRGAARLRRRRDAGRPRGGARARRVRRRGVDPLGAARVPRRRPRRAVPGVAATSHTEVNISVYEGAERRAMLCNVVDVPPLCNFILPAIVRNGPLAIAISTAGASPALAKRMKREIAEAFGEPYARLAVILNDARGWAKATLPTYQDRKEFFEGIVNGDPDPVELVRDGREDEVRALIEAARSSHAAVGARLATAGRQLVAAGRRSPRPRSGPRRRRSRAGGRSRGSRRPPGWGPAAGARRSRRPPCRERPRSAIRTPAPTPASIDDRGEAAGRRSSRPRRRRAR